MGRDYIQTDGWIGRWTGREKGRNKYIKINKASLGLSHIREKMRACVLPFKQPRIHLIQVTVTLLHRNAETFIALNLTNKKRHCINLI